MTGCRPLSVACPDHDAVAIVVRRDDDAMFAMSALRPEADIRACLQHVCFVPDSDIERSSERKTPSLSHLLKNQNLTSCLTGHPVCLIKGGDCECVAFDFIKPDHFGSRPSLIP
jgi:hypothetical protein